MLATDLLEWDPAELAAAMKLPPERVLQFFKDGRRFAWLFEESLATRHGMTRQGETDDYDLVDAAGRRWEARGCTKGGLFFCPSNMVGKGRTFNFEDWVAKQAGVAGWIVADVTTFPRVPYWVIPDHVVGGWWNSGELGPKTQIGRVKFAQLIRESRWDPIDLTATKVPAPVDAPPRYAQPALL